MLAGGSVGRLVLTYAVDFPKECKKSFLHVLDLTFYCNHFSITSLDLTFYCNHFSNSISNLGSLPWKEIPFFSSTNSDLRNTCGRNQVENLFTLFKMVTYGPAYVLSDRSVGPSIQLDTLLWGCLRNYCTPCV